MILDLLKKPAGTLVAVVVLSLASLAGLPPAVALGVGAAALMGGVAPGAGLTLPACHVVR